jgi:hypothetical protein
MKVRRPLGEETITDLNLLNMAIFGSKSLQTIPNPKIIEGRTGFDFEMFIKVGSKWRRLAIQAKRIKFDDTIKNYLQQNGGYKYDLNKETGGVWQGEILRKYCSKASTRAVPYYCFYNYCEMNTTTSWKCCQHQGIEQFGWTLAPLKNVIEAMRTRGKRTFSFFHCERTALPIRCVTCPKSKSWFDSHDKNFPLLEQIPIDIEKQFKVMDGPDVNGLDFLEGIPSQPRFFVKVTPSTDAG